MTIFILHGGYTSTPVERNKVFYQEIVKRMPDNGKILFIYFAQDESKWSELLENDRQKIENCGIERKLRLELAKPSIRLSEQISAADCVYIRGGKDDKLRKELEKINVLEDLVRGKIVVGISAGANILSRYFYRNSTQQVEEGLRVLQIKVFCHYNPDKKDKLEELKAYEENLPVYTIPEADFIVIEN